MGAVLRGIWEPMETLSESLLTMAKPDLGLAEPCFLCI